MAETRNPPKSDLAGVLKAEIARLARKEVRVEMEQFKKSSANFRAQITALRAEVASLHKDVKRLSKQERAVKSEKPKAEGRRHRFTASGFATLRARLDLSRAQMGLLIGASDQSVRNWEEGTATPRENSKLAIFELRGIGKKEAAARLASLPPENTTH